MRISEQRDAPDVRLGVAQRIVATYTDHAAAQETVRRLEAGSVSAERSAIVGIGLHPSEGRYRGRLSTLDVLRRGAASGLVVGALVGWLLEVLGIVTDAVATAWLIADAGLLGALLGACVALIGYAATLGHRSFEAAHLLQVDTYAVLVDADLADAAVRRLKGREAVGSEEEPGL